MENMNDIDSKVLSVLKIANPRQLWGVRNGRFILDTGATEKNYSRAEVAEILNRERAALEVKANMIQTTMDLLKEGLPEENSTAEILVDAELFGALVRAVINAKSIREFPEDVRDALEESDRAALDQAVAVLNRYKRKIGEEEIY